METIAPGMTAPDGSVTIPLMEPALDWARRRGDIPESRKTDKQKRMRRAGVRIETLLRFLDVPRGLFFSLRDPGWSVPETLCMLLMDAICSVDADEVAEATWIGPKSQFRIAVKTQPTRGIF
jgi:hypothetical protein